MIDTTKAFCKEFYVSSNDVGKESQFRLSHILKTAQEIGELHLDALDVSYEKMKNKNLIFVTIRSQINIYRLPKRREVYQVTTKNCGISGVKFFRSYRFEVAGEKIVEVVIAFLLVDVENHKIQKPNLLTDFGFSLDKCLLDIEKINLPNDMKFCGERVVRYSDLDYNGHLNNAIYADIFCDFFPGEFEKESLAFLKINFMKETFEKEQIQIHAKREKNLVYLSGINERGVAFTCMAKFRSFMEKT